MSVPALMEACARPGAHSSLLSVSSHRSCSLGSPPLRHHAACRDLRLAAPRSQSRVALHGASRTACTSRRTCVKVEASPSSGGKGTATAEPEQDSPKQEPHLASESPADLTHVQAGNELADTEQPHRAQAAIDDTTQGGPETSGSQPSLFRQPGPAGTQSLSFDDVNPVGLGRRSRQFLDDVWRKILELGQPARPVPVEEEDSAMNELIQGASCEFAIPNAEFTKVLVVGPTGRVGRVLVRKLLLRGYSVRVLVRRASFATMESLPGAVEVMEADLEGDVSPTVLQQAVFGCQKVIYCATSKSPTPEELAAVDTAGVVNMAKAMLDYNHHMAQRRAGRSSKSKAVVVKFNKPRYQQGWALREGRSTPSAAAGPDVLQGAAAVAADAEFEITDKGHGLFQGYVVERGSYVEVKRVVEMPDGLSLGRFEGLVMRVIGDGRPYSLVLEASTPSHKSASKEAPAGMSSEQGEWATAVWALMEDEKEEEEQGRGPPYGGSSVNGAARSVPGAGGRNGAVRAVDGPHQYMARFSARRGPSTVRIPFSAFRPTALGTPPLDPTNVTSLAIRFEQRRPKARGPSVPESAVGSQDPYSFRLEVDFIKAFPGGDETDFILVSCTGAGVPEDARPAVVQAKQAAENQLRNSGLGYTIIRPGPLFEEPGGRKALVFDQGNRISQGISCADVADVCVKALHDPLARNKSFDICYEYSDGSGLYELVAHLPDKANNYLTPALALLEKNT